MKITIVGCGPGNPRYLTTEATDAIRDAKVLIGSERLLSLFPEVPGIACPARSADAIELIEARLAYGPVTVLVSGDTGICSLATPLVRHFGIKVCRLVPGISSVQVAFARLGLDWRNAKIVTAHAKRPDDTMADLEAHDTIAILAGSAQGHAWLDDLRKRLAATHDVYLCQDLTLETERICRIDADDIGKSAPKALSIYLFIKK